jgi:hypothetical protein
MRPVLFLFNAALCVLILVTAVGLGVARGQAKSTGSVVLCTGFGQLTVAVDATGAPIEHASQCPDCATSFFNVGGAAPVTQVMPVDLEVSLQMSGTGDQAVARGGLCHTRAARAPPVVAVLRVRPT